MLFKKHLRRLIGHCLISIIGIGLRPSTIAVTSGTSGRPTAICPSTAVRITMAAFVALSLFSFFYFIPVVIYRPPGFFSAYINSFPKEVL